MARIVTGAAKDRTIKVPASSICPASERVCETLLPRLNHLGYVEGRAVPGPYSGPGVLSLEITGRGVAFIEYVESSYKTAEFTRTSARALNLEAEVDCIQTKLQLADPS